MCRSAQTFCCLSRIKRSLSSGVSALLLFGALLAGCGSGTSTGLMGSTPSSAQPLEGVPAAARAAAKSPPSAEVPSQAPAVVAGSMGVPSSWRVLPPGTILAPRVGGRDVSAIDPFTGSRRVIVSALSPTSVAYGEDGCVYVSGATQQRISRFDPATGLVTPVADLASHGGALDMAFESAEVLVAACGDGAIVRVDVRSGVVATVATLPYYQPYAIASALLQNRIFAVGGRVNQVIAVDARTGDVLQLPYIPDPGDVDVDAEGNLLVADVFDGFLFTLAPGSTTPQIINRNLWAVNSIAADTDGTVVGHDQVTLSRFFPDGSARPITSGAFLDQAGRIDLVPSVLLSVSSLTVQRRGGNLGLEGAFAIRDVIDVPSTPFIVGVSGLTFEVPGGGLQPQGRDRYVYVAQTPAGGRVRVVLTGKGDRLYGLQLDASGVDGGAVNDPARVSLRVGKRFAPVSVVVRPRFL